jgi:multicomponent Na+:H+ antiporter subunit D
VAVVKAGVFGLLRTLFFFIGPSLVVSLGVQPLILAVAALTILVGSLLALIQDNLKLRLAYSTISQLSYIVLGAALLTPSGLLGAAFHIAAHGFAKLTMFFVAGSILVQTGKTRISELDGIGKRMPGTMMAFALAALAMASLPPMAPFVSKWYLSVGAWEANQMALVLVLATSSVLNIAYFFPIVMRAFFAGKPGSVVEGPLTMYGPILATAAGALVLGLWTALPYGPFEIARVLARGALP